MISQPIEQAIFWSSLSLLAYCYVGYPALVRFLSRFARHEAISATDELSSVTVVLCAYNEAEQITSRLQNLLASDYPPEKLGVLVVSDGSSDGTDEKVRGLNDPRVRLIAQPHRSGKAQSLNVGVLAATGDIVVLCDTRQRFAAQTISRLAAHFRDQHVGAVSGSLEIDPSDSTVGSGIDVYWRIEKSLRSAEAKLDSCIGCTGAVYAIRKGLFQPLPPETLLDDVVIPLRIATQGFRIAFEPEAVAYDPQPLEPKREQIRKRRTLAGNYQMLFQHWRWLLPWKNRLWWMLISHKYLRLAAPLLMLLMFVSNLFLIAQPFYRVIFFGQCIFYLMALCGLIFSGKRVALFSIPAGFVFLNWTVLAGLWHYLREPKPTWEKAAHV